jgi:hypothetical protein
MTLFLIRRLPTFQEDEGRHFTLAEVEGELKDAEEIRDRFIQESDNFYKKGDFEILEVVKRA